MPLMAITGVGGFIGHRMVERAIEAGYAVRGVDLSQAAAARAADAGADARVGDVNDAEAARWLVEGAGVVFHTAAIVEEDGRMDDFARVNVEGTRNVAAAAKDAGVKRFVHLSSIMVHGLTFPPNVTEDGPTKGDGNPYCETKIESEKAALSFHEPGAMEVIVIRPGDVYGPGGMQWIVRPMQMMRRRLFALPDGGRGLINHVHVDNLIDAVFLALDKDATGEAFTITDGAPTTCKEFYARLAKILGQSWVPAIPAPAYRAFLGVFAKAFLLLGKKPLAYPVAVDYLLRPNAYSCDKARRVLGYSPRIGLEEGMDQIERWWKERARKG